MYGDQAAQIFIQSLPPESRVLDIGAGRDKDFRDLVVKSGHEHVPFDLAEGNDWESHIRTSHISAYDGVWMSHVLEHIHDTHAALLKIHTVLRQSGIVGITVPPMKAEIVGGHVSLWNAGLLLYRLVLAGFDCKKAAVKTYGYNCSVVVRSKRLNLPELKHDHGDIETLAGYFPVKVTGDSYDGAIREANWQAV